MAMTNRRDLLKSAILASGASLIAGCASDEIDEQYQDSDPFAYAEHKDFLTNPEEQFDYHAFNGKDYEGHKRSTTGMDKHRPIVKIAGNKKEFTITFNGGKSAHPHKEGHYWSWVEIVDAEGTMLSSRFPEPSKNDDFYGKDGTEFSAYIQSEEALKGWVRVRACCTPHGEFLDYVKVD